MGRFSTETWIDLGDFGQHLAQITGITGDFGYVNSIEVTFKGEAVDLVRLLPRDEEQRILEEVEINEREYMREQAIDRQIDEDIERRAA